MFKALATRLSIALFLSHDIGREEAASISELMTAHWRGIISLPVSLSLLGSVLRSGLSKALHAKARQWWVWLCSTCS